MSGQRSQFVRMVAFSVLIRSLGRFSLFHWATVALSVNKVSGSRFSVILIGVYENKKKLDFLNDLLCQTGAGKLEYQFEVEHSVINYKLYNVIERPRFQFKFIFVHKTSMQLLIWNVICVPKPPGIGIEGRRLSLLQRRDSSQLFFEMNCVIEKLNTPLINLHA